LTFLQGSTLTGHFIKYTCSTTAH